MEVTPPGPGDGVGREGKKDAALNKILSGTRSDISILQNRVENLNERMKSQPGKIFDAVDAIIQELLYRIKALETEIEINTIAKKELIDAVCELEDRVQPRTEHLEARTKESDKEIQKINTNMEELMNTVCELEDRVQRTEVRLEARTKESDKEIQKITSKMEELMNTLCELKDKTQRHEGRLNALWKAVDFSSRCLVIQQALLLVFIFFVWQVCLDAVETLYPPPPPEVNVVHECMRMFLQIPGSSWWY